MRAKHKPRTINNNNNNNAETNRRKPRTFDSQFKQQCRNIMERLFKANQFTNLNDFLKMKRYVFRDSEEGRRMMWKFQNNFEKLLKAVYPNYPWKYKKKRFALINNEEFYNQVFNLQSEDPLTSQLLDKENNEKSYLRTKEQKVSHFFDTLDNQRRFLNYVYQQTMNIQLHSPQPPPHHSNNHHLHNNEQNRDIFQLSSLSPRAEMWNEQIEGGDEEGNVAIGNQKRRNDLKKRKRSDENDMIGGLDVFAKRITKTTLRTFGGASLLRRIYHNDLQLMFLTIYPNYPWNHPSPPATQSINSHILNYHHERSATRGISDRHCGDGDVESMKPMISTIKSVPPRSYKTFADKRDLLVDIYRKLGLQKMEDWLLVSKEQIKQCGAQSFLQYYFKSDVIAMLTSIFPNFCWHHFLSSSTQSLHYSDDYYHHHERGREGGRTRKRVGLLLYEVKKPRNFFKHEANRRLFLESIFNKLRLWRLDQFLDIPPLLLKSSFGATPLFSLFFPHHHHHHHHHHQTAITVVIIREITKVNEMRGGFGY
jgi:hypothetical protein